MFRDLICYLGSLIAKQLICFSFVGGHFGFGHLVELAHTFGRDTPAHFLEYFFLICNPPSNLCLRTMVTDSPEFSSTTRAFFTGASDCFSDILWSSLFTSLTLLRHICWRVCSLTVTYDWFPVICVHFLQSQLFSMISWQLDFSVYGIFQKHKFSIHINRD